MRAIGNIILSTANFDGDAALLVDGVAVPVRVRRSARARAYRLSLDAARGELRLSLPARATQGQGPRTRSSRIQGRCLRRRRWDRRARGRRRLLRGGCT